MKRRITRAAITLAAAGALSAATVAASAPTALASATSQRVAVPDGLAAGISARATPDGITPSATLMRVSFVLRARNWSQLSQAVQRGWHGPYLSVQQFAAQYGQSLPYVAQLVVYLESFGIRAQVMPDLLDVTTQGTAAEYSRALSVLFGDYQVTEAYGNGASGTHAAVVFAPRTSPTLPEKKKGEKEKESRFM
jgi:kumamolisin